ncbi:MAG TPA: DUF2125 domain-containing protein [Paracoccaceae bacterium]|nr:DUF2125 domain-containing protein [Paracoccaceae bacterium]
MKHLSLAGTTGLAVLLTTSALHAQVTAQEVWNNWKELSAGYGQTMTAASENMSGDTLTVSGISISQEFEGGNVLGTIDEVLFREIGDGKVEITMSPTYPITMNVTDAEAKPIGVMMEIRQTGLKLVAGGSADETTYDFSADSLAVVTTSVTESGNPLDINVDASLNAIGGGYVVGRSGDQTKLTSNLTAGDMAFTMTAKDPATATDVAVKASIQNFAGTSGGTLIGSMDMENLGQALAAGFATDANVTYGAVDFTMDVLESGSTTNVKGTADTGNFAVAMDKSKIAYAAGGTGVDLLVSGSSIPFPEVAVSYAEAAFDFLIPIAKGDAPQDFRLVTRLVDFSISDMVWAMFDPAGQLPRDPATLIIEAAGTATISTDIMDPDQMAALGGMPPGMPNSLNLSALQVKAVGAELTGTGALTFDPSDMVTFNGIPAPSGVVDLKLVGANKLIDSLIAMGMLPEDQAMGARMMMGMFARPGDGPDTLQSTLEFKEGGFFANGMRLQ